MKIYFAGSIRGGRDDAALYQQIIALLRGHGEVLTEHVGDADLTRVGENGLHDRAIYERDMAWLEAADAVIAEVTVPSHGVGYEIARAEMLGKPVLCLHRRYDGQRLSAMLAGNVALRCESYATVRELTPILQTFFSHPPARSSSNSPSSWTK
jgi:nucleoside 2-deoxyribosyltransferase